MVADLCHVIVCHYFDLLHFHPDKQSHERISLPRRQGRRSKTRKHDKVIVYRVFIFFTFRQKRRKREGPTKRIQMCPLLHNISVVSWRLCGPRTRGLMCIRVFDLLRFHTVNAHYTALNKSAT